MSKESSKTYRFFKPDKISYDELEGKMLADLMDDKISKMTIDSLYGASIKAKKKINQAQFDSLIKWIEECSVGEAKIPSGLEIKWHGNALNDIDYSDVVMSDYQRGILIANGVRLDTKKIDTRKFSEEYESGWSVDSHSSETRCDRLNLLCDKEWHDIFDTFDLPMELWSSRENIVKYSTDEYVFFIKVGEEYIDQVRLVENNLKLGILDTTGWGIHEKKLHFSTGVPDTLYVLDIRIWVQPASSIVQKSQWSIHRKVTHAYLEAKYGR